MPLQQLVEYFNDRLEHEHNAGFRPFLLENNQVNALYGAIRIGSTLLPVRTTSDPNKITGHTAQLRVISTQLQNVEYHQSQDFQNFIPDQINTTESIVNFDRLSRAVHMLNYLPQSHLQETLFLTVDPRHILGVKEDHGAYFEEIIVKCGLQTNQVAITMPVSETYARFYQSLLKGLSNYQRRGYQLALKLDSPSLEKSAIELISRAAPDFVGISAQHFERTPKTLLVEKLHKLTAQVRAINGQSLLQHITDAEAAEFAATCEFNLVEGDFFEKAQNAALVKSIPRKTELKAVRSL